jgi:HEAT repeat protein
MKKNLFSFLLLAFASAAGIAAQGAIVSPQAFASATFAQKRAVLRDIILHDSLQPPRELAQIVHTSFTDADPRIREGAAAAVRARMAGYRFDPAKISVATWQTSREPFQALRPDVIAALSDPVEGVRLEAVSALASMDEVPGKTPHELSPETVKTLVARFQADRSPKIRGKIASGLSENKAATSKEVLDVLRAALQDRDVMVRSAAASGAWKLGPDGVALLAAQLRESAPNVRMRAADELAKLGPTASAQLGAIDRAASRERDVAVRKKLQAASERVSGTRQ